MMRLASLLILLDHLLVPQPTSVDVTTSSPTQQHHWMEWKSLVDHATSVDSVSQANKRQEILVGLFLDDFDDESSADPLDEEPHSLLPTVAMVLVSACLFVAHLHLSGVLVVLKVLLLGPKHWKCSALDSSETSSSATGLAMESSATVGDEALGSRQNEDTDDSGYKGDSESMDSDAATIDTVPDTFDTSPTGLEALSNVVDKSVVQEDKVDLSIVDENSMESIMTVESEASGTIDSACVEPIGYAVKKAVDETIVTADVEGIEDSPLRDKSPSVDQTFRASTNSAVTLSRVVNGVEPQEHVSNECHKSAKDEKIGLEVSDAVDVVVQDNSLSIEPMECLESVKTATIDLETPGVVDKADIGSFGSNEVLLNDAMTVSFDCDSIDVVQFRDKDDSAPSVESIESAADPIVSLDLDAFSTVDKQVVQDKADVRSIDPNALDKDDFTVTVKSNACIDKTTTERIVAIDSEATGKDKDNTRSVDSNEINAVQCQDKDDKAPSAETNGCDETTMPEAKPSTIDQDTPSTYHERKLNNFKDVKLEKVRQDCIQQRLKLRSVPDPEEARRKKQAQIQETLKTETRAYGIGLTETELQEKLGSLKKFCE